MFSFELKGIEKRIQIESSIRECLFFIDGKRRRVIVVRILYADGAHRDIEKLEISSEAVMPSTLDPIFKKLRIPTETEVQAISNNIAEFIEKIKIIVLNGVD